MKENKSINNRVRPRVPFSTDVVLSVAGNDFVYHNTSNISMSGLFIRTESLMDIGTQGQMLLKLECGDKKAQVTSGFRVVRQQLKEEPGNPLGMAIEFFNIDPESSIILFNIVKYQDYETKGSVDNGASSGGAYNGKGKK